MSYLPKYTTRVVIVTADSELGVYPDGSACKRLYAVAEGHLGDELAPLEVMGDGLKYWSAYVDSLTANNMRVRDVVTVMNHGEFLFGLSRCLSRPEVEYLSEKYPNFYKENYNE